MLRNINLIISAKWPRRIDFWSIQEDFGHTIWCAQNNTAKDLYEIIFSHRDIMLKTQRYISLPRHFFSKSSRCIQVPRYSKLLLNLQKVSGGEVLVP